MMSKNGQIFQAWITLMQQDSVIHDLQESQKEFLDSKFADSDIPKISYKSAKLTAKGLSVITNEQDGSEVRGFLHNGNLVGNASRKCREGSLELFFCKSGIRHGYSRTNSNGHLQEIGLFLNGHRRGIWWKKLKGGGWIMSDKDQDFALYMFCDFHTILAGTWDTKGMKECRAFTVEKFQEQFGMLCPVLTPQTTNKHLYFREKLDANEISMKPLLPDPYESTYVEVRTSLIPNAGQGLFAKKFIPKDRIVAFFHGLQKPISEVHPVSSEYSIGFKDSIIIDLPEKFRSLDEYQATLGHKICHSFDPNATYSYCEHPRFGLIRCAKSVGDISPGSEITCNYKYALNKAPRWYKESLESFLKQRNILTTA